MYFDNILEKTSSTVTGCPERKTEVACDSWELPERRMAMKTSFVRLMLWLLLLAVFELANILVIWWLIGPLGLLLGLMFAFLGVAGIFIVPNSPGWLNTVWTVLSLVVNSALVGRAAMNVTILFALGDPLIPWMLSTVGFAFAHVFLVYKARVAISGYFSRS